MAYTCKAAPSAIKIIEAIARGTPSRGVGALILDAIFFSSLFVLGGDFWEKLSALFVRGRAAK